MCRNTRKSSDQDGQVVIYNENEKRVYLKEHTEVGLPIEENLVCALCRRPLDKHVDPFVDQNYFRLLGSTTPSESSQPFETLNHLPRSAFNQGYYARFFREGRRLGRGARGSVFLAQHILERQMLGEYAIKKVPVGDDVEWLQRMLREVHILESLRHPNIISYKHSWLEMYKPSSLAPTIPCLFILMEYANGGSLEDYVLTQVEDVDALGDDAANRKRRFKEGISKRPLANIPMSDILYVFLSVCRGLEHLHYSDIVHRDLKPSNILLNYRRSDPKVLQRPDVLISDFGECNRLEDIIKDSVYNRTGATGTIEFCAPELLQMDSKKERYTVTQSKETDIWSLGMLLYYLLANGNLPYKNVDDVDVLKDEMLDSLHSGNISLGSINRTDVPLELKELLADLLSMNPASRPSAREAVERVTAIKYNYSRGEHHSPRLGNIPQLPGYTPTTRISISKRAIVRILATTLKPWMSSLAGAMLLVYSAYPNSPSAAILVILFLFAASTGLFSFRWIPHLAFFGLLLSIIFLGPKFYRA